jgi:FkbM family methyltransferase
MLLQLCFLSYFVITTTFAQHSQSQEVTKSEASNELIDALQVLYPLRFFNAALLQEDFNWRTPGVYDQNLADQSEKTRGYLDISKAQDREDVWLYENWFYGVRNGIIVESGALDGFRFSNSYMFENFANWTAIHVEADPENFRLLKQNRKNAVNVHGALCSEPSLLHYCNSGIDAVRGFIEFMPQPFIRRWHPQYLDPSNIRNLPVVHCLPLKFLLKELNVLHVDIWILDVEGAEENVLQGMDFSKIHINAIAMECDRHDPTKNERKTAILEKNNFVCHLIERNCMCKNKNFQIRSASYRTPRKPDGKNNNHNSTVDPWF